MSVLFVKTGAGANVTSDQWVDIAGLRIEIPKLVDTGARRTAVIILNIPDSYATDATPQYPGLQFAIAVDHQVLAEGQWTYESKAPASFARQSITLVHAVPLTAQAQTVEGQWRSIRTSTGLLGQDATLTVIIQ